MTKKRVLIVYYTYTQQTKMLVKRYLAGLEEAGIMVHLEQLEPINPYAFPFRSNLRLAVAMVMTFFQKRMAIRPVSHHCFNSWDCIVLAGPTWSYHPSGPVLDFLDRYGRQICAGNLVIPLISCRSYWQLHYWTLKKNLMSMGATVQKPLVYMHPTKEPWRFIGLVLKLRGKMLWREYSWFKRHYPGYGHSKEQGVDAMEKGRELACTLLGK